VRTRWILPRHSVALLSAAVTFACGGEARHGADASVTVIANTAGPSAGVEIAGVSRSALGWLARRAPNDSTWTSLAGVYVERSASDTSAGASVVVANTPAVIGRYAVVGDRIHFTPRFPFAPGVAYWVRVDTAALRRLGAREAPIAATPSAPALVHRFAMDAVERPRTTRVVAVYPSASRLPSNLLRWYVEFSAPMEPGNALAHVHLMDEVGREVSAAFLALDQELWDPERRRLTLLFDPGRVKRGVRTNLEMGAPLVAGRRYRLVIDKGWLDGDGAPLVSGFEHPFEAVAADRRSPEPERWRLTIPVASTREALGVAFGEALDHALATRMLAVFDETGRRVPGSMGLLPGDSSWQFTPERGWEPGDYTLRVEAALEDVAGNNVARVFDADMVQPNVGSGQTTADTVRVRFRVQ